MGSYRDKSFNPTQKIILAEYETWEEALEAEVLLHEFYDVARNPHFANKARQTSSGFYFDPTERNKSPEMRQKVRASWTEERKEAWKEKSEELWTEERRAAQAERMANQNRSERHRERMRTHNPGRAPENISRLVDLNKARKGQSLSKEHKNKISQGSKGHKKKQETRDKMRSKATGRKLITNGEKNTWLHPGQEMPEGWKYGRG